MLAVHTPIPVIAIIVGAIVASVILGLLLRSYRGHLSESSTIVRVSLVIVLAIAVGATIFASLINPLYVLIGSVPALFIGTILLWPLYSKRERDTGKRPPEPLPSDTL